MTTFLLNAPVLTNYGHWNFSGPLPLDQARSLAAQAASVSAIGHPATARRMTALLGIPVPCCRIEVAMQRGDSALVFRLLQRLPEGMLLDDAALQDLPHEFGLLERLA